MAPHRLMSAGDVTLQPPATRAVCISETALRSNFSLFYLCFGSNRSGSLPDPCLLQFQPPPGYNTHFLTVPPALSLPDCCEANLQARLQREKATGAGGVWFLGSGARAAPEPPHPAGANPPIPTSDGAGCKCTGAEVPERNIS